MPLFSQKDIVINNLTLHTESFGNPSHPACILIAGKMSTARFWSDIFCQYLADHGFFTIRYDHRDVGQSSEIDWQKAPYTMADMAKDAISILDGYGIKKAHFVGDSMGGWLCQRIGVDYPQRILSLTIISAGPLELTGKAVIPLTPAEQETLDATSKLFLTRKDGHTLEETIESFLPVWRHCNGDIPLGEALAREFTKDFLTRTTNKNFLNHEYMMSEFLASWTKPSIHQPIDFPTLVIHGDKDPVVLPRHGQAVADSIPSAKMVMIPGMGHVFFNRELEGKIARLVVDHMKKVFVTSAQ